MSFFEKNFLENDKYNVCFIAVITSMVMLPVLFKGIPYGYDLPHHFQCAFTFYESFINGNFYPSWSLFRNEGFGGMEIRLYPPISHYTLAIFYFLCGDWHIAVWLTLTFFTVLGSLGIYLWAREMMSSPQAVFAACIYAFLPYHLTQVYNTFFYAEFAGCAVLPFCFAFVARVCKHGRTSNIIGLAIAYCALILTHLPLTVIGSVCLGIYAVSFFERKDFISKFSKLATALIIALAGSSFFWVKVLQERDLMAKTSVYPDPWLDYRLHFLLTPIQTFQGLQLEIYESSLYFYDLMFLCAVGLALICTVPFIFFYKFRSNLTGVWLIFSVSVFMATPFSRFVWDGLPFLQEVQFPWRWLSVVCITASMLSAAYLDCLVEWFRGAKRPLALLICGGIFAALTFSISQIVAPAPFVETSKIQAFITETQRAEGFTFWWTNWTRKEIFNNKEQVSAINRVVQIQKWTATEKEFQIAAGDGENARIAVFYHPNWQAEVNGVPVAVKPDENGASLIFVSNQLSNVKFYFLETAAVQIARLISGIIWLCIATFFIFDLSKKNLFKCKKPENNNQPLPLDFWHFVSKIYSLSEKRYVYVLVLGIAVLTLLPMILFGVFNGGDLIQHVQFASTFENSIRNGNLYPSWGGFENSGYGSNGVRFYPPAVPFSLGLARILTGDWLAANSLVFLIFTIVGSFGVYLWAKEYLCSSKAVWASVFFILMPYRLIEIHNASTYAEFAGIAVLPFSFVYLTRICRDGKYADVLGLAMAYAALILTHLPSTVIGSLSLFVYALLMLPKGKIFSTLLKLATAVALGVCASSIYWSKMVFERDWLRITKFWHDEFFNYSINFLFTSPWFDARQLWFFNLILLSMIFLVIGCVIGIYYKKRTEDKVRMRGLIGLFFGAVFMTTILSQPIWAILPYLHEVQFPWRWLTVASLCASVLAAIGIESLSRLLKTSNKWEKPVKGFVISISILFIFIYGLIWTGFQLNYIPAGEYESWVVEKSQGIGGEWFWTTFTKEEAFSIREKIIAEDRTVEIILWEPEKRVFTVEAGKATNARVATLFYPYWRATVNNQPIDLKIADDGSILTVLPSEKATVEIKFEEPLLVKTAAYVSVATWLVFTLAVLYLLTQMTLTAVKNTRLFLE